MVCSCETCSNNRVPFVALDIATIFNHYCRYHRHDPNIFVTCKVPGCGASYRKLEGFRSHIRRYHKDVYMPNSFADEITDIHVDQNNDNIIEDANEPQYQPEVDFSKQNALFLLKSKEIHQLSEEATKTLLSDTTSLIQRSVEQVKDKVKDCLNNAGMQLDDIVGLKEIFSPENAITNPFTGLKTKTEQKDYFKNQFGLVVSFSFFGQS